MRIVFQQGSESLFDKKGDTGIRPGAAYGPDNRGGQQNVPDRAETNQQYGMSIGAQEKTFCGRLKKATLTINDPSSNLSCIKGASPD